MDTSTPESADAKTSGNGDFLGLAALPYGSLRLFLAQESKLTPCPKRACAQTERAPANEAMPPGGVGGSCGHLSGWVKVSLHPNFSFDELQSASTLSQRLQKASSAFTLSEGVT